LLELRQALAYASEKQGEKVITPKMKRRIKRELSAEKPTVWVGKEGATQQIVNEISRQLDKREIVKAKILKSALKDEEAKSVASKIAKQTDSSLIEVRGHTFLLYKRRKKR
jgi:RNA-binding protein